MRNVAVSAKIGAGRIQKVGVLDEVLTIDKVPIGVNVKGEAHMC